MSILPYFYFAQAILLMIITLISSKYLKKSPKKFVTVFKLSVLFSLLIFIFLLKGGGIVASFFISIFILSYVPIITLIAWNCAADIFNIQEFKCFSKVLQVSSTSGAITAGLIVATFFKQFQPSLLLGLFFIAELTSFFLIKPLDKYVFLPLLTKKTNLNITESIKKSSLFKYLALMTIAAFTITILIDYNLKLAFYASIAKQEIAYITGLIFSISTTGRLIVQLFFIDYFFRIFGSKKIIIISPLAILIVTAIAMIHFNFMLMAAIFIINDIVSFTTSSLSTNLYLKVLPQAIRNLGRLKLNGTIVPIAIIFSSFIILGITSLYYKSTLVLVLIVLLCIFSLYVAKVLIKQYRLELAQSIYLRRFNSDLIGLSPMDNNDNEYLIKQALSYPALEATIFGLQFLDNNKSLPLPNSLKDLLMGDNSSIVREAARVLAGRRNQQQFVKPATLAFSKSDDEETKWYLALYLMESDLDPFLTWAKELLRRQTGVLLAIFCLINIKQGDLEQQINAMEILLKMFHSPDIEQKKWFLYVLKEIKGLNKENYLIQFINQDNPSLQILALQQVNATASDPFIDSIVCHIGDINIVSALTHSLIIIGERVVGRIENRFNNARTYLIKISCIRALCELIGEQSDQCLMRLLSTTHDVILQTIMAKYIAHRGIKLKISEELNSFLINQMKREVAFYFQLTHELLHYKNPLIIEEIISRLQFIKKRVLYYIAASVGSSDILNGIPLLTATTGDKNQQSRALELIDSSIEDRKIALLLSSLFKDSNLKGTTANLPIDDPWLNQYIQDIESNNMDTIYPLTRLRKIDLFKNLAAETLQVLAGCCSSQDMTTGEIIFNEGDEGDGLYIIDSGEVSVMKSGNVIAKLSECDYFGELALLADIPRFATITAISDGVLFYIDKQDFDKITDEIPEIMKSLNRQVIKYLVTDIEDGINKSSRGLVS